MQKSILCPGGAHNTYFYKQKWDFFSPKGQPARPGDERRRRSLRKTAARDRGPAPRPRHCRCAGVFRYTVHIIPIRLVKPARDASDAPPQEEGGGVRSGPGEARTILLLHIISARPSKQPLMVRTFLKVYMELVSFFLVLQEQIKDIIIICEHNCQVRRELH